MEKVYKQHTNRNTSTEIIDTHDHLPTGGRVSAIYRLKKN